MIKETKIGVVKVWFYIDVLRTYNRNDLNAEIIETNDYIAYFKFAEPSVIHGELLRDENKKPKLFSSVEDAVEYGTAYVRKIWNL